MASTSATDILIRDFKHKSPSLYDKENIQELIEYHIPILYRILKNNQHYSHFIQALDASKDMNYNREHLFDFLCKNVENILKRTNGTYYYDSWSIHTDIEWGRGWQDEFRYSEIDYTQIKSYKVIVVMAFGMLLNSIAHDCFKRGFFYSDYVFLKNYILQTSK